MRARIAVIVMAAAFALASPASAATPGTTTWLSRIGFDGPGANGTVDFAQPSADGSRVLLGSAATNFGDGPASFDRLYIRDVRSGTVTPIGPAHPDNFLVDASISGDGRWVAFSSQATM